MGILRITIYGRVPCLTSYDLTGKILANQMCPKAKPRIDRHLSSTGSLKGSPSRERSPSFSSVGHHREDHDVKVPAEVFASMMWKFI